MKTVVEVPVKDPETLKDRIFVTSHGDKLFLNSVAPFLLQRAQNKVAIPKPPEYEIKTPSGRVERYYIDEVSANEEDHGKQLWQTHLSRVQDAEAERNNNIVRTSFAFGVEKIEYGGRNWEKPYKLIDEEVPTDEDEKRLFYLLNELTAADVTGLLNAIMKLSGVSEEKIKEAEDSFRSPVPTGLEVSGRDNGFGEHTQELA